METTQYRSDDLRRTQVPRRWLTASAMAAALVAASTWTSLLRGDERGEREAERGESDREEREATA